jgi:hypothetical protein
MGTTDSANMDFPEKSLIRESLRTMIPPVPAFDPFPVPFRDDETPPAGNERPATGPDLTDDDDAGDDQSPAGITLDALHDELIATSSESRRGNRRMLEVLKNFSSVLDALAATVNDTHKAVRAIPASSSRQAEGGDLPREWALALVELADRLGRVNEGFSRPPAAASSWWPGARNSLVAWNDAWAMQADALGILCGHLATLLKRADLSRLEVLGRPFDPNTMTAVESAVDPAKPDHTVLAELLPGWRHAATGQLLRPAHVRVSRLAANTVR